MNTQENDPDTLQLLDELNEKWVKQWRRAATKRAKTNELKLTVFLQEKSTPSIQRSPTRV
jgi:hypothetical protein